MAKKLYNIKWIALIGDTVEDHRHESIETAEKFENAQEGIEWAKKRISIEVVEADDKGEAIPTGFPDEKGCYKVDWDYWHTDKKSS